MNKLFERLTTGTLAAVCACLLAESTRAQPAPVPPTPPAGVEIIHLGDIGIGDTRVSDTFPIAGQQNIWFSFRLTEAITPETWLNIDTTGSTIDTEIGLYDRWTFRNTDDDRSGGGMTPQAASIAPALTFGGGSGKRLGEDGVNWFGGRIDTGWNERDAGSDIGGGWRPRLPPGLYYVVVVGFDADFGQSPNPNFIVSTNFIGSGSIRLRLHTGTVPPTTWSEYHHGGDAGSVPSAAQTVTGHGPLTAILGAFHEGERDCFKIRICDPAIFRATATLTKPQGNAVPAQLFLFDSDGRGRLGINSTSSGDTTLSLPAGVTLAPGDYYLAVSTNCGGLDGFRAVPYDASLNALWDFSNPNNSNRVIAPNGTGQNNPVSFTGRQSQCVSNADFLFHRLSLIGACHVPEKASCPVDFDGDGEQKLIDYAEFQNCFGDP